MKKYIINKNNLIYNIENIINYVKTPIIGIVKGDGYGLGILKLSAILHEKGINIFAVSEPLDALLLRKNNFENVLLLTPQANENILRELINNNVILTVASIEGLNLISKIVTDIVPRVHIKIDTGFGRFGFNHKDIDGIDKVFNCRSVKVEAIFSHFSTSFEKEYKITKQQTEIFKKIVDMYKNKGIYAHIANSCAALRFFDTHFDAVRIGSAFLGRLPVIPPVKLYKIGYLTANVIETRVIEKGGSIGYGNVYKVKKNIKTCTVDVGYKDGFEVKKEVEIFRLRDVLRYIYGDIKAYNKQMYLYENENKILGQVGMNSTIILNERNLKPNDEVKISANPLYIDSSIEREFIEVQE